MPPHRSTRVNNEAYPAFTAARFRKEKPQTFSLASTPVETENWREDLRGVGMRRLVQGQYFPYSEKERCEREYKSIRQLPEETSTDFMKRFLRLAGFVGAKADTQEEHAKHFKWGLNDFVLDRILNTEFTDVAQVANAARNIEIFRDRSKNEGTNKRDKDSHRIRPSETPSQGSNPRADDRRDSDRYGNRGKHGNRDRYGTDRWRSDKQGSDRHGNGSNRQGNGSQKACFIQERRVTGLPVLALNVERLGIWLKIVRKGAYGCILGNKREAGDVYRLHGLPSSIVSDRDTRSLGNLLRYLVGDHVEAWDQKLCQAEFAHNHVFNRSTGFSPFPVVYSAQPRGPLDLMTPRVSSSVPKKVADFVHRDRFPVGEFNKLSAKKIGPLKIVEKINSNAYRLKLPSHIRCSDVFNVKHLIPYHGDSSNDGPAINSRTNFAYPGPVTTQIEGKNEANKTQYPTL
ncbi:zinc finger, CCHC-type, retrotransposon gag domain protein [Tanacetum coccineum]